MSALAAEPLIVLQPHSSLQKMMDGLLIAALKAFFPFKDQVNCTRSCTALTRVLSPMLADKPGTGDSKASPLAQYSSRSQASFREEGAFLLTVVFVLRFQCCLQLRSLYGDLLWLGQYFRDPISGLDCDCTEQAQLDVSIVYWTPIYRMLACR